MATEDKTKSVAFVIMLENEVVKHLILCSEFLLVLYNSYSYCRVSYNAGSIILTEHVTSMMSFHLYILKHL